MTSAHLIQNTPLEESMRNSMFKAFIIIPTVMVIFFSVTCFNKNSNDSSSACKTKYPLVLVHGIAFRDVTLGYEYWGEIPGRLREYGAAVYTGKQDAYAPIEVNAEMLKQTVDGILASTGSVKVNIIAHSRGGLEARYMISRLGMAGSVASLTTVSTPHRGSGMADIVMEKIKDKEAASSVINLYSRIIGDKNPESLKSGFQLTTEYMEKFNKDVPDATGVYYQSYGSVISSGYPNPVWASLYGVMKKTDGENDGLVSESSCRWGNFRGLVTCDGKPLVTHADIIGMNFITGEDCFDAPAFFVQVVSELKGMGY